jgi:hypothetical protein
MSRIPGYLQIRQLDPELCLVLGNSLEQGCHFTLVSANRPRPPFVGLFLKDSLNGSGIFEALQRKSPMEIFRIPDDSYVNLSSSCKKISNLRIRHTVPSSDFGSGDLANRSPLPQSLRRLFHSVISEWSK